jgi:hypothetical protein
MDYCFDTSAFSAKHAASLYDDPDRSALVAGLLASGHVLITAVNVIEAAACENSARRVGVLHLQAELSRDHRPLLVPTELLQRVTIAHFRRETTAEMTISDNHSGIWWGLHEPERLGEVERQEVYRWKLALENPFDEAHRKIRPEFDVLFRSFPQNRPFSVGNLIRFYRQNERLILDAVNPAYQKITESEALDIPKMRTLFEELPAWRLYLAGWAHSLYHRGLKEQGYGPSSNPGTIDLMSAIYLNFCDCFVTSDVKQRRALRVLNSLNSRQPKTRIISYQEFRNRLIIQTAA